MHLRAPLFSPAFRQLDPSWQGRPTPKTRSGRLEVDDIDANLAQVEAGMAWHNKAYFREQSPADRRYAKAEDRARDVRQGLWADRAPVAPWDLRKARPPR